jgi:hypothetical protein
MVSACIKIKKSPVAYSAPIFCCFDLEGLLFTTLQEKFSATWVVASSLPPSTTIISALSLSFIF